jgi:hypothetical protein
MPVYDLSHFSESIAQKKSIGSLATFAKFYFKNLSYSTEILT